MRCKNNFFKGQVHSKRKTVSDLYLDERVVKILVALFQGI